MTGPVPVRAVATSPATQLRGVQELAATAGLSTEERDNLAVGGLVSVPVATEDLVALVSGVIGGLRTQDVTNVVFTHSLELDDATTHHLHDHLVDALPGLGRRPVMLTGRPCSVIHLGLALGMHLYKRDGGAALVIGGDVAPSHGDRFFFGSAMGDAAVGLVLGGPPSYGEILASQSTWQVLAADGVASDPDEIAQFRAQNPTAIRATIAGALAAAGLDWPAIAAIVPHTPYRQIWDTVAQLCRFPRERVLDDGIAATGHLNSNDVLVHLDNARTAGLVRPGDVVALVSPGFGGCRGCTLIRLA